MSDFQVHILGCGSALPTAVHYPTSQVVELRDKLFMIDCGEGAAGSDFHLAPAWRSLLWPPWTTLLSRATRAS